jgi:PAS domain S-box-containing protein
MPESLTQADPSSQRRGHGRREDDIRNERLARLLSQVTEGIICVDRNWMVTFANEEACYRSRITPADIGGARTYWEIYPHLIGTELERFYRNVMQTGEKAQVEYYSERINAWYNVSVYPTDEGIALFYHDVTDRKGAELLRDTSIRQLRQVLETTTDAVASIDRDWNFSFLNRRARELLSPKGDLIGKNLWQEFPVTAEPGEFLYHYHRAMDEGIPGEFEVFYPEPLNLWLSVQCRPHDDGIVVFFRDVTARQESDLILRQQQELLASVQQTALVATWDIDYATGKVTYGAGSYPVFGHPLADISDYHAFKKIVLPQYIPIIAASIQSGALSGQLVVQEFQVRAADGRILWLESRGHAVIVDGVPFRLRGLTIDITTRKKNEEALVASEARYRVLTDLNPQAIWMGAPDGSITYANQGFLDYIGLTIETIGGLGWLEAFHPDDQQRVIEAWKRCVVTGADYDIEARLIRARDGHARWWWLRAQAVRDESGKILNWLGVAIDIDDRKTFAETLQQRQEETERERAELETIYQTAPIALGLFDPVDFRYLRLNDRLAEIIGLLPEQILGRPITEVAPTGVHEIFEQVLATRTIQRRLIEGEFPNRPGDQHFFNVNYAPVFAPDGSIRAIATATLDITHQKKAEAALIQSEKLAAVGRLASSISHEINNPLEAITNLLYLIALADDLPPTIRGYVETAQSELSRVCQIATQTLRFHRQAVRATSVSAAELVDAVLNLYQGRLANSNIHVDATYATATKIVCFENDIRQVLNNLIANAIDAMRHGGQLLVRAHDATDNSSGQPRRGIRITIADTGLGMSPTVRARLFEPFYTTKNLNGTGLGLWISAGIVARHHGRLTLRSSEDHVHHGTVFSLFLPCIEPPTPS